MKKIFLLGLCLFGAVLPTLAQSNPDSVTIAGSFQAALGCAEDWSPACDTTFLTYDADGDVWLATFDLPAGDYEYKAAINADWGENYGAGATAGGDNIVLSLAADTSVTFIYDHKTHWVTDSVNSVIATAPGSYQAAIGCPDDWRPECLRSWLQDPDGDGIYTFTTPIPAGTYETKVAINRNWTENYGVDGVADGGNYSFTVGPSEAVTFSYNTADHILTITTEIVVGSSDTVTLVGDLQSEIGCAEDWQPDCTASYLTFETADAVWQGSWTLPAGTYAYKVALDNSWDVSYGAGGVQGGDNLALTLAETRDVKFYYDPSTNWVTDNVSSVIATVAGDFQQYLGCGGNWDPSCLRSWLKDVDGDGIYTFSTNALPFGIYSCKVAVNEGWDENYGADGVPGGDNINFLVPADNAETVFRYTAATHILEVVTGGVEPPPAQTAAYAVIHYRRADGDYGDHTTGNYQDYWGLHLWGEAVAADDITDWAAPKPFLGETDYGRFAFIKLSGKPGPINFIVHRGDTKDGTDADRVFNPADLGTYDLWLVGDDGTDYASRAQARGFAEIRYHRPDGAYGEDGEAYWGLHLWGEALDPAAVTDWQAPRRPDGVDAYGAYWHVPLNASDVDAADKALNFIVHQPGGDDTSPEGNREPGGDRGFVPAETGVVWLVAQDEAVHATRGAALGYADVHYHRPAGDYGDYDSAAFGDYWGMHNWTGAAEPVASWDQPLKPVGFDTFGAVFRVPLTGDATELAYILHRGDEKDPGPDQILELARHGYEVWQVQAADADVPYVYPIIATAGGGIDAGNIRVASAYWLTGNTLLWSAAGDADATYQLHYAPTGGMTATEDGISGGAYLTLTPTTEVDPFTLVRFPHLIGLPALRIADEDMALVGDILKGQVAVSKLNAEGKSLDAAGLQTPGALDDLYAFDGALGLTFADGVQVALWAPTAKSVTLQLYGGAVTDDMEEVPMTWDNGVWRASGPASWKGRYYTYGIDVYVPEQDEVVHSTVTDPYAVGLSQNSARAYMLDLDDPAFKPAGWDGLAKPPLAAPEDITIYETHLRDFSVSDPSVPDALKGTFKALTLADSHGVNHLRALQQAGLSHLHLLPAFDIATIEENPDARLEPDPDMLAAEAADSDQQQAQIATTNDLDAFNWGYDPYHYNVPEGSYSTDANGGTRTMEFREMVAAVNNMGLRVVMDVVYNHTAASGQNDRSVLDKIVPGYYHRRDNQGNIEHSTCCENTASEHYMMGKLMVDSLVLWAKQYKVDAFRFDLMGHHMVTNMQAIQAALQSLTLEADGVDGSAIYLYGEGWNFGEVADNARGRNATQHNVGGLGIGTFSDRMRDAVRGGGPFDSGEALQTQGFANGLYYDANSYDQGDTRATLNLLADRIRVELAGGLADFSFVDRNGNDTTGAQLDYNGQPSGYTKDPQELISYVSKHDNQTLFDINVFGAPVSTSMDERVRMQIVGLSLAALGQGVPFFHAGVDLLRSKSLDRDSYNSGDWFNRLDFTYQSNNFGVGLPVADKNEENWWLMAPLLANPALKPGPEHIQRTALMFRELLALRKSSKLFRLETADDIMARVSFHNTGPDQLPGLIAMHVSDAVGDDLDPAGIGLMVLFNANDETQIFTDADMVGRKFDLHPIQADGVDDRVKTASYDKRTGSFTVPGRTTVVMVESVPPTPWEVIQTAVAGWEADGTLTARQAEHLLQLGNRMVGDAGLRAYFVLSVNRYVDWGYLTPDQAALLLEAAADL